jgi:hypothetical protein
MIERRTMNAPRGESKAGNGTQPATLEQRLASAVSGSDELSVEQLQALIAEAESAAAAAAQTAIEERERALDLSSDPASAQQRVMAADLARDRLQAALPKLQPLLDRAWRREAGERWQRQHDAVAARLEDAAERFARYPELAAEIVELLTLAAEVDKDISAVNQSAPPGRRHLKSVELTARQLQNFSISQPSITRDLKLPNWSHSEKTAWPRSEPFTPPFEPAAANPLYSDEWWKPGEQQRQRAAEREAAELEEAERQRIEFYSPR